MWFDGVPDKLKKLRTEEGLTQDQLALLVETRHGIVLTENYIAKKQGVKTGMALW